MVLAIPVAASAADEVKPEYTPTNLKWANGEGLVVEFTPSQAAKDEQITYKTIPGNAGKYPYGLYNQGRICNGEKYLSFSKKGVQNPIRDSCIMKG